MTLAILIGILIPGIPFVYLMGWVEGRKLEQSRKPTCT